MPAMNLRTADSPRRILILVGHPAAATFGDALADAYAAGARSSGANVRILRLRELTFDPVLHDGYRRIQDLEPDLKRAQTELLWAQHIVIVYPVWWGSVPALLKGFLDRVLQPEFAFRYHEKDPLWDKLLAGRSAHLIATSDAPSFWIRFAYRNCDAIMMRKAVLQFCGIAPVGLTRIGKVRDSKAVDRAAWIEKIHVLGRRQGVHPAGKPLPAGLL